MKIPVVDIFAGPGGLAEGFSEYHNDDAFEVRLSIEKDPVAHQTLLLRSFLRCFEKNGFPEEYYKYVSESDYTREDLFKAHPVEAKKAETKAWQAELGKISPSVLHDRIGQAIGKNTKHWVLLGGPPCQAYSLVGRARLTGLGHGNRELPEEEREQIREQKLKEFSKDERHTLYKEYLRIVAVHAPTVFVMENVKGILSSKHSKKPIFERILNDMRHPWEAIDTDHKLRKDKDLQSRRPAQIPRYRLFSFVKKTSPEESDSLKPKDFTIRTEDYGIPQKRHRVIVLGVREDYFVQPGSLAPELSPCTVKEALDDLPVLRSGLSKAQDNQENWLNAIRKNFKKSRLKSADQKTVTAIENALPDLEKAQSRGSVFIKHKLKNKNSEFSNWIYDAKLPGVLQHETRGHMTSDLWRYMYASAFASANHCSPKVDEFPEWLLPDHKNVHSALNGKEKKQVHFRDRFRVQTANDPATTITSHISKDGHYYIHYDPSQCRSLTVREAARLQTFPDNYFFEGNRTQQYHQVGNAVPPLLANKLAHIVCDVIGQCCNIDQTLTEVKSKASA